MCKTDEMPPSTSSSEKEQEQEHQHRRQDNNNNNVLPSNPFQSVYISKEPDESDADAENDSNSSRCRSCLKAIVRIYWEQEFLILVVLAILLAMAYPPLGAKYVQPDITASWIAVIFIFFVSGLSLKTSEFSSALKEVYFNAYVQIFNFGVTSSVVFGLARLLALANILRKDLTDGIIIAASLPMTTNMVQLMTKAAGGDEAAAIFNAAFGNLVGVFISPALILGYIGTSSNLDVLGRYS
jgi:solute carrier family 10 (sodium/bile acid cotransporter), member 7